MPTPEAWLQSAATDASRRGADGVRPVLEALAKALTVLREAEWNADAARPLDWNADAARPFDWSADAARPLDWNADAARDEPREGPVSSKDSRG